MLQREFADFHAPATVVHAAPVANVSAPAAAAAPKAEAAVVMPEPVCPVGVVNGTEEGPGSEEPAAPGSSRQSSHQ